MSSPAAVGSSDSPTGVRYRQGFNCNDLDADDHNQDVIYMDEQSQQRLIQDLQKQNLAHNEFYSVHPLSSPLHGPPLTELPPQKALKLLTASGIPYFMFRLYFHWSAGGWILNNDVFFLASLVTSYTAAPEATAAKPLEYPDDRLAQLQIGNIVLSCLLCLWTWAKMYSLGTGESPGVHEGYVCALPFCECSL